MQEERRENNALASLGSNFRALEQQTEYLEILRDVTETGLGNIVDAARGDLKWLLVMREDRTLALNGTAPPLIEWSIGPHVSQSMPNKGLILIKLTIAAPDADALNALFKAIDVQDDRLGVEYAAIKKITATLQLPSGQKIKIG